MRHGQYRFILGFLVPPVALYLVFVVSPYLQAFQISMTNWRGFSANRQFTGLKNYRRLWHDDQFWNALKHNALLVVAVPLITIGIALFLAYMLNAGGYQGGGGSRGVRGTSVYRVVFFFPYVLSIAIVAVLWQFIYNPRYGLLNGALDAVGLHRFSRVWLDNPHIALYALIAVIVWNSVGFYVVLFSAAMQNIPTEIYEAALLDAATPPQTFFRVTLPLLWGTVRTGLVYLAILSMDSFAIVHIMTSGKGGGGPDNSTQVVSNYLYFEAFNNAQFGYASAIGVALFVLTMGLAGIALVGTRRETVEY
jgi:N-acetylglucosamine transport system permease protein